MGSLSSDGRVRDRHFFFTVQEVAPSAVDRYSSFQS